MIKPLYGFISDSVPLWGYRRRSYLAVCGLMGEPAFGSGGGQAFVHFDSLKPQQPVSQREAPLVNAHFKNTRI
jgi:hypothetical protein